MDGWMDGWLVGWIDRLMDWWIVIKHRFCPVTLRKCFWLYAQYIGNLSYVLNQHAPLKAKCPIKPKSVWITQKYREAKQFRRQAERTWRKNPPLSIVQSCDAKSVNVTLSSSKHKIIVNNNLETRKSCGNNLTASSTANQKLTCPRVKTTNSLLICSALCSQSKSRKNTIVSESW